MIAVQLSKGKDEKERKTIEKNIKQQVRKKYIDQQMTCKVNIIMHIVTKTNVEKKII